MKKKDKLLINNILGFSYKNDIARKGLPLRNILNELGIETSDIELFDIYSLLKTTELIDDKSGQAVGVIGTNQPFNIPFFSLNEKGIYIHNKYDSFNRYKFRTLIKSLISEKNIVILLSILSLGLAFKSYQHQLENSELERIIIETKIQLKASDRTADSLNLLLNKKTSLKESISDKIQENPKSKK